MRWLVQMPELLKPHSVPDDWLHAGLSLTGALNSNRSEGTFIQSLAQESSTPAKWLPDGASCVFFFSLEITPK